MGPADLPCYELSVLAGNRQGQGGGLSSEHTFLIGDFGLFMEHAVRLAADGHRVLYCTDFFDKFPHFNDYAIGLGMPGVTKVASLAGELSRFRQNKDDVTVVFPDVGFGGETILLRQEGYAVFGAGRGDTLENRRIELKRVCAEAGISIAPWRMVKGLTALRDYLAEHAEAEGGKYVKLDIFRGDQESFPAKSLRAVEFLLDNMKRAWGPFGEHIRFIVEDMVGVEEVGHDGIFGGAWLRPYLWGTEITKGAYAGRVSSRVPKTISGTVDQLGPSLADMDYRGFCSTEIRVDAEGKTYLIDVCSRAPSPLGIGYTELFENFSEIIYSVARGIPCVPKYRGKYLVILPLESRAADKSWMYLDFSEGMRSRVKLRLGAWCDGQYYGVPGLPTVFVLVGVGNDLMRLRDETLDLAAKVDAWDLISGATGGLTEAVTQLLRLETHMPPEGE